MTNIYFVLTADPEPTPESPKRERVRMHIELGEPTHTDSPGDERRAVKDALSILHGITDRRADDAPDLSGLVSDKAIPCGARPLFAFAIGVSWVREGKYAAYKQIDHSQFRDYYAEACSVAMSVYCDDVMSALKKAERAARLRSCGSKFKPDRETVSAARNLASEYFAKVGEPSSPFPTNQ